MSEICKDIGEIHACNKLILNKIDAVCREHGIVYHIEAGTLLGAVRHKGFIPWDDDVDIVFTRSEYEKFLRLPPSVWGEDFRFVSSSDYGENIILDFTARVIYKKKKLVSVNNYKAGDGLVNHPMVDCFILDTAYKSAAMRKIQILLFYLVWGLGMGHRNELHMEDYKGISRAAVFLLSRLGRLFSGTAILKWYEAVSRMADKKQSGLCIHSNYPIKYWGKVYESKWYAKSCRLPIDERTYNAPAGYSHILKRTYGDYMKLPPKEQRVPEHSI